MPNNLRHDLDGATPEQQAFHLALQREVEVDLTGYATEQWVKKQDYLTSIPDTPSTSLESVLAAGNEAGPGQSIRMDLDESNVEELEAILGSLPGGKQREVIEIEGRSGLRLGGSVSTYTFNEPITIDLEEGEVSTFQACRRKMSAPGDLYTGGTSLGHYSELTVGVGGFKYWSENCVDISIHSYGYKIETKNDAGEDGLEICWHRTSNRSHVKADEFIGDGSKLTGVTKNATLLTALQASTTFEELKERLLEALEES